MVISRFVNLQNTNVLMKNGTPACNEKKYQFIIDNLPQYLMVPDMTLSKLDTHSLKLVKNSTIWIWMWRV